MKKNYIYLTILLIVTVIITLFLSNLYKRETTEISYSYEMLNKITANEFEEYMIEHPDTIIYIADKTNLDNNKFEKKFVNKLEKLNLLENVVYIEKEEMTKKIEELLKKNYSYEYKEKKLPIIIVISDAKVIENSIVQKDSDVNAIINYEVFE